MGESTDEMILATYWLFPELDKLPSDDDNLQEAYEQKYQDVLYAYKNAIRILGSNCEFISEEIYELLEIYLISVFSKYICYY